MSDPDLALLTADQLFTELAKRFPSLVLVTLERRTGPGGSVGHAMRYAGCPYGIATLLQVAARDWMLRFAPQPPASVEEIDDEDGEAPE